MINPDPATESVYNTEIIVSVDSKIISIYLLKWPVRR